MLYGLIPTMPEQRLAPFIERFAAMLAKVPPFGDPVSFAGYMGFETVLYWNLRRRKAA